MATVFYIYLIVLQLMVLVQCFEIEENYFTNENIMRGLMLPSKIDVTIGEDIFMKLVEPMDNQKSCLFRKPGKKDVDVTKATDNVEPWAPEICGLHIKGVTFSDSGYWRLTSTTSLDNELARGIVLVNVKEKLKPTTSTTTSVQSPSSYVSPKDTTYCYVLRPNQAKTEFPHHDKCKFPEIGKELDANGIWHIVSGVKGKTEEVIYEINVQTKVEDLVTSVKYDNKKPSLILQCALINSDKVIKFCRFLRLIDNVGFNVVQGQGTQKYRYYGNGFDSGECGLEIQNPDDNDKSTWKCYLGVEEDTEPSTVGAILDASPKPQTLADSITTEDVFGLHNSKVNLLCKSKVAAEYCWFRHPNGNKISVSEMKVPLDDDEYRYYGTGVKLGECGISIMQATVNDSGSWSCHMGTISEAGQEAFKDINVRISESNLVASSAFHEIHYGAPLVIECTAVPPHLPIEYCRFVQPDGVGFSINENATSQNLVLENYYFHPNRKRSHGHCSIVIKRATKRHSGQWTCAGRLVGREHESWDDFQISVFDNELSAAAISGMVLGAIFVLCATLAIAYFTYKKRYRGFDTNARRSQQPNRSSNSSSGSSEIEMHAL